MPFPWKKVKKTSISQLVKEHVHSKRNSGSPLMVETGFPTSLVDLFVKNRSIFRKPFKKKKHNPPISEPSLSQSTSPSPPPPPPSPLNLPNGSSIKRSELRIDDEKGEKADKMKTISQCDEKWGNSGVSMNQGLVAVLKMFLVVGLVLGMNNLVVGITMSAFLLFFLEYVDKSYSVLAGKVQRVLEMFRAKVVKLEKDKDDGDCVFKAPLQHRALPSYGCSDFGCQIQEIEVVQEPYVEESQYDEQEEIQEEFTRGLIESKEKKSHKAKIKSKIKKLVPKKFRKKKGSALGSHRDEVVECFSERKPIHDGVSTLSSVTDDDTIVVEAVGSIGESSKGIEERSMVGEEDGATEKENNSMYIVLILVVLVGLIGGRLLALLFTIMCCLISKRGEGIRRYTKKLPVIRCFA